MLLLFCKNLNSWGGLHSLSNGQCPEELENCSNCYYSHLLLKMSQNDKRTLAPWGNECCCVSISEMAFTLTWTVNWLNTLESSLKRDFFIPPLFILWLEILQNEKRTLGPWGNRGCCVSIPEMAVTLTWTVNTLARELSVDKGCNAPFQLRCNQRWTRNSRVVGILLTLPHNSDLAFL